MKKPFKIPLSLHLFIHFFLAVLSGYLLGLYYNSVCLGIITGILGGFLIDLDHVLEYFLVYGPRFKLSSFLEGRQFLSSGLMRICFHAWEYIPVLLVVGWLLRAQTKLAAFFIILVVSATVHLISDCFINRFPFRNYLLLYRWSQHFESARLLSPEQYRLFLADKVRLGM